MRVRDALHVYLAENGFTAEGYDAPKTKGSFLGFEFSVPNPPSHQRGVRLHDLMHVATGYGTDHAGEGEISAWQARRGLRGAGHYVAAIVLASMVTGVLLAPKRTLSALFSTRGRGSLFDVDLDYETLLDRTVGELRDLLDLPRDGLAVGPRGLHSHAPSAGRATV
jgi:hypothetical protein